MVGKVSEVAEGELFAFAGIWDRWKDTNGKALETCSTLTTTPNAVTSTVHDRMPVMNAITRSFVLFTLGRSELDLLKKISLLSQEPS